tara:strand:- start:1292 stop:1471 length:180 start_codon:yes stop_codon:yes gene_type:complete
MKEVQDKVEILEMTGDRFMFGANYIKSIKDNVSTIMHEKEREVQIDKRIRKSMYRRKDR